MKLDDIRKSSTFQQLVEILVLEQIHFSMSPPKGERGRFSVQLYDMTTGEIGTGSSSNVENALIFATAGLERANLQRTQESSCVSLPDSGELVAIKAS